MIYAVILNYWLILLFTFVYSQSLKTVIHVILILLVILHIYNNVQCKLSGFNMFNGFIVLFFIAMHDMSWCFVEYWRDPPHVLHSVPPPSPLLSKSHIGILCLILIRDEVDIGSFKGEGVISHVFIYLIESVAFTVLLFCFSLSIINQCNNY